MDRGPTSLGGRPVRGTSPQRTGAGVAFSETPWSQSATASQPSAFSSSPAATDPANAFAILSSVRFWLRMREVSAATP